MPKIDIMRCGKRIKTINRKIRSGGRGKWYLPHVIWKGRTWPINFLKGDKVIYPWGKKCKKR